MNLIKHENISRLGSRYKFLLKYKDSEDLDKLDDKITDIEERIIGKIEEVIRIKGYEKVFEYFKMGYKPGKNEVCGDNYFLNELFYKNWNVKREYYSKDNVRKWIEEADRIKEEEDIKEQKKNLEKLEIERKRIDDMWKGQLEFNDDWFKVEKFDRTIDWELLEFNLNKMIEKFNGYAIQYNDIIRKIIQTYPKIIIDEQNQELIEIKIFNMKNSIKGSRIMFDDKEYEENGTIRFLIKRKIKEEVRCYYERVKPEDILLKRDLELFKQGKEWKLRWLKYEIKFGSLGLNRIIV